MFGYVRPHKGELLMREFSRFRAVYCGICKEIGRSYGQVPRVVLTYDITMLGVLMISLSDEYPEEEMSTCILNPIQKKPMLKQSDIMERCAALSVILAYGKALDEILDGNPIAGNIAKGLLSSAARKASIQYPDDYKLILDGLKQLEIKQNSHKLNTNKTNADTDLNANINETKNENTVLDNDNKDFTNKKYKAVFYYEEAQIFGEILGDIFKNAFSNFFKEDPNKGYLVEGQKLLGNNMGKWIFILDCIDDLAQDRIKGTWNPFLHLADIDAKETAKEILIEYEKQMDQIAALLPYKRDAGIISNIIQLGLPMVREKVFSNQKLGRL